MLQLRTAHVQFIAPDRPIGSQRMRELVILGSSIVTSSNSSSPTSPSLSYTHSSYAKPFKRTISKLTPSKPPLTSSPSSSSISTSNSCSPVISTISKNISSSNEVHLNHCVQLASELVGDGNFPEFAIVLESAIASGVEASEFFRALTVERLVKAILIGLQDGEAKTVIDILNSVHNNGLPLSTVFDGSAMDLLGKQCRQMLKCGRVEELVEVMEILSGSMLSVRHLVHPSDLIKYCVCNRDPHLAVRYACLLPHAEILFCTIINEFGKSMDLVSALGAYEAAKKILTSPNMFVYRTIIDACGICGQFMKSRDIYEFLDEGMSKMWHSTEKEDLLKTFNIYYGKAQKTLKTIMVLKYRLMLEDLLNQKIIPNTYVFNSVMNVNAHDLSYIFGVYKNMQNLGVRADVVSYNILLKACSLAGRIDLAHKIYQEVKHLQSEKMLKLDVFTYSTIVKVFADAKLWELALKVKQEMMSAGVAPNIFAWSSLISACANAAHVELAIQVFEEMLCAGCEPNTHCFNTILHACVEARQYDRAFRLFQSWSGTDILGQIARKRRTNASLSKRSKEGELSTRVPYGTSNSDIANFPKRFSFIPSIATYHILMKACGTDYYRCKALMEEIKISGLSPKLRTWSILMDICGASGNVEGAIEILETMRGAGLKPDVVAYTTAIKVCVERKSFSQAFFLYEEMKRNEIHPNAVTYDTLIRTRSRYGSLNEVRQCLVIYQDMRKAGYKANDRYLRQLIEEWCEGVIQGEKQNQVGSPSSNESELVSGKSLVLEKVATHLQKTVPDSLTIDLQGLTKVEARLVVLAALRMIKENHALGHSVDDDMLIIVGVGNADAISAEHAADLEDAVIKLLRVEMGLEILPAGTSHTIEVQKHLDANMERIMRSEIPTGYHTRRPAGVKRLKVTRNSLQDWLHRKVLIANDLIHSITYEAVDGI